MNSPISSILAESDPTKPGWLNIVIVGVIVGFLLSNFLKERGFGFFGNALIGIVGAILGGFLWDRVLKNIAFISENFNLGQIDLNQVVVGLLGAIVFLTAVSFVNRRKRG